MVICHSNRRKLTPWPQPQPSEIDSLERRLWDPLFGQVPTFSLKCEKHCSQLGVSKEVRSPPGLQEMKFNNIRVRNDKCTINKEARGARWLSQVSVRLLTTAQVTVPPFREFETRVGFCADSVEPARDSLSTPPRLKLAFSLQVKNRTSKKKRRIHSRMCVLKFSPDVSKPGLPNHTFYLIETFHI